MEGGGEIRVMGEEREREVGGRMTQQMGSARRSDGGSSSSPLCVLKPPTEGCGQTFDNPPMTAFREGSIKHF